MMSQTQQPESNSQQDTLQGDSVKTAVKWGWFDAYRHNSREYVMFALTLLYVLLSPFNKVEESFHMQASHDVLIHGTGWYERLTGDEAGSSAILERYDHLEFPGVVPRSFLGALFLSAGAYPWKILFKTLNLPKVFLQILIRGQLGAVACLSYARLSSAVGLRLGHRTARAMAYVALLTPHFLFYASRTLPNTFAVVLVLNGLAEWVRMGAVPKANDLQAWFPAPATKAVTWLVCAVIWFRCDMLVLLAPILLSMLYFKRAGFWQLFRIGVVAGVFALSVTVLVDSYFWRQWLWPEGIVLFFNTVQNRSHEYGVMPWHWYFTSALPRSLLCMLFIIPIALITTTRKKLSDMTTKADPASQSAIPAAAHPAVRHLKHENSRPKVPWASGLRVDTEKPAQQPQRNAVEHSSKADDFWGRYQPTTFKQWVQKARCDEEILEYFVPGLVFVLLYSFLPHKELRFLLPGMPLFHIAAARGLSKAYRIGEALVWGLRAVRPSPEVVAAELLADMLETTVCNTAPAVAEFVGTPRAVLKQRQDRYDEAARVKLNSLSLDRKTGSQLKNEHASVGRLAPADPLLARVRGISDLSNRDGDGADRTPNATSDKAPHISERVSPLRFMFGLSIISVVVIGCTLNAAITALYIRASMNNYPGGEALQRLYTLYATDITQKMDNTRRKQGAMLWKSLNVIPAVAPGLYPPCPWGDVAANNTLEFWRQCVDAKHGCPPTIPKIPFLSDVEQMQLCLPPGSQNTAALTVHIDVKAAETGVSRFGEAWSSSWRYSKEENLKTADEFKRFHFLLTENATMHTRNFDVIEVVSSFTSFDWSSFQMRKNIALFIMRRKKE